eukprot:950441-Prymnesium_polylepis.1
MVLCEHCPMPRLKSCPLLLACCKLLLLPQPIEAASLSWEGKFPLLAAVLATAWAHPQRWLRRKRVGGVLH